MDYINFLNRNADPKVIKRGMDIFNGKDLRLFHHDNKTARFHVKGNDVYTVTINYNNNNKFNLLTDCTCPYNYTYSGLCKHVVAAIYYMAYNPEFGKSKKDKRNTFHYLAYTKVDKFDFNKLDYFNIFNSYDSELKISSFEPGKIVFDLYSNNNSWNYKKNIISTTFKIEDNIIKSKCSCSTTVYGICEHEAAVLKFLEQNEPYFFKKFLKPENYLKHIGDLAKEYNLSQEKFTQLVTLKLIDNKISLVTKNKNILLSDSKMEEFGEKIDNKKEILGYLNGNFKRTTDFQKLGVGVVIKGDEHPNVYPVSANINKKRTELISSFNVINSPDSDILIHNPISDFEEFLSQSKLLNTLLKDDELDEQSLYNTYEKIFSLLKNFDFVYYDTSEEYSDYGFYRYDSVKYGRFVKIVKRDLKRISVLQEKIKVKYKLISEDELLQLVPYVYTDEGFEKPINESTKKSFLIYFNENNIYLFKSLEDHKAFEFAKKMQVIQTSQENAQDFFENILKPLSQKALIDYSKYTNYSERKMKALEKNIYLSDIDGFVLFTPEVVYNNEKSVNPLENHSVIEFDKTNKITNYQRDIEFEKDFINTLKEIQPVWKKQFRADFFHLPIKMMMDKMWFLEAYEKWTNADINVHGLANLKYFKYKPYKASVTSHIESGQDWFDVEVQIKFGDIAVSLADVKKAIKNKNNYILLSDGSYGILPEKWLDRFERYFRAGEISKDKIKISKLKFHIIEKLFDDIDNNEIIAEIAEKKKKLKNFSKIKTTKVPKQIKAELRNYQKEGLNWLNFLHEYKWGGILADDMGLGKTIQIISFFKQIEKESKLPNLVVVPTTLIFNWETEFKKFAPDTSVHFHYGGNRDKDVKILKKQNIIISSYGTLTNDIELFSSIKFNYIVLDESQAIKNPGSLRYKAMCTLKANNRIVCTGTPIENNTFDLYAQFNFINPGFFGSQNSFKEKYSLPIDKNKDEKVAAELQELINPFVLRRTKEQVVKELPPKTENILYCSMEEEQMKVYLAYRNKYREYLLDKIDEEGIEKSKMYILEGLLKLRQICDSPALLSDDESYGDQSIKIKELLRHIKEKTRNHKILVFSQFVSMLQLIKKSLLDNDILYEYLDGQCNTKQRQQSVENFQNDEDVRIFLISLKAGGQGINLTAADYVYIVDPWWNPAVENQAIDRCYRIGQNKKVFAYRMICKDTVEEKILNLQDKKRQIAENIIQTDESIIKKISKEQILDLFS